MASPLDWDRLLAQLRHRPQLAVVIGGGIAVGAVLLVRSQSDAGLVTDTADTPDGTDEGDGLGTPDDGSSLFDPFGSPYSGLPTLPDENGDGRPTTPEGCTLPVPTVPAQLADRYLYACRAGVWTLIEKPAQLSPGGCPLPKPRLDPALGAAGWVIVCDAHTHAWRYARKPGHDPKPRPKPDPHPKPKPDAGPSVALAAGPHRLYDVKAGGKHGRLHAIAAGVGSAQLRRAVVWTVAGAPVSVELTRPDGTPIASARMVQVRDRDAGNARGRFLELGAGAVYAKGGR